MYDITPLELSVDTMQLAINTGCLEITTNSKNNNTYLGFKRNNGIDFPSLSLKKKSYSTGFSYTSREHANWVSVYEEEFNEMIKRCYEELTDKHVVFVKNIDEYNL